jgi:hypothetical protein
VSTWVEVDTMFLRITRYGKMTSPVAYPDVPQCSAQGVFNGLLPGYVVGGCGDWLHCQMVKRNGLDGGRNGPC